LLDDDSVLGHDFIEKVATVIEKQPKAISTGDVLEHGKYLTVPTNPKLLGHFGKPIRPGDRIENINLNCNVFPRNLFDHVQFDESIVYGYEDTDVCAQAISQGFEIRHEPSLVNKHLPSSSSELNFERRWHAERARFRMMIRRLGRWSNRRGMLAAFIAIAPVHLFFSALKTGEWRRCLSGWVWVAKGLRELKS